MAIMDIFNQILDWFSNGINAISAFLLSVLPNSPFALLDATIIQPFLPYLNYFIPLDFIMSCSLAWISAISCYYAYSIILRLIRAVH